MNDNTKLKARAVFLTAIMVLSVVGAGFAGSAAAVASGLTLDDTTVQSSATVTVSATAETAGNDITFAIDVDGSGAIESGEKIATITSDTTTGEASTTFKPSDYSTGEGDFSVVAIEEGNGDGVDDTTSPKDVITYDGKVILTVDNTPPTVSDYSVTNPTGQDVTVSFNSSEQLSDVTATVSGAESATLSGIGTDFTETANNDGTYTYTATHSGSVDGDYTIALDTAVDAAGNDGAGSESGTVTVDTTAPTIDSPNPGNHALTNDNEQIYTVSLSDATTGVDESSIVVSVTDANGDVLTSVGTGHDAVTYDSNNGELTVDPTGTYADGDVTVTVDASDNDGNDAPQFQSTFTVDTNSLTVGINSPSDGAVEQSVGTISGTADDDNGVSGVTVTITDSNGAKVVDGAAATYDSSANTWTYDSSAITAEDTYTITATVTDDAGNTKKATSSYTIDTTDPAVSNVQVVAADDNAKVKDGDEVVISATVTDDNDVTVTADASSLDAGSSVTLTDDNGDDVYNATVTVGPNVAEGTQTVNVNAVDAAGNSPATASASIDVDLTAPTISTFSANYDGEKDVTVTVTGDEELDSETISVDIRNSTGDTIATVDSFTKTGTNTYEGTHTFSETAEGTYSANLTAGADIAGNSVSDPELSNDSFVVDTPALDLTIDDPTSQVNLTSTSELNVKYSYSDTNPDSVSITLTEKVDGDVTPEEYTYNIDDSQYANDDTQKSLTVDLGESGLPDGAYFLTVEAQDADSGTNSTTTDSAIVVIDDTEPAFGAVTVEDDTSTTTNISIGLSDTTSGVDESSIVVQVEQDGSVTTIDGTHENVTYDGSVLLIDTENVSGLTLEEGEVTFNVTASDYSGNTVTSSDKTFTINTAAPAIDRVEAEAGEDTVTVYFTEEVAAVDGDISLDDFAYTDVSGSGASEIIEVRPSTNGFTSSVELVLDSQVADSDLSADEVNVRDGALADNNNQNIKYTSATTHTLEDTTEPAAQIVNVNQYVNAANEGAFSVTVNADSTSDVVDVWAENESGEVARKDSVDISGGSATVELDLSNAGEEDITIYAEVSDRSDQTNKVSTDVTKDTVAPSLDSAESNAGTFGLYLTFDENVQDISADDVTIQVNGDAVDVYNVHRVGTHDDDPTTISGNEFHVVLAEPLPADAVESDVTVDVTAADIAGNGAATSANIADGGAPNLEFAEANVNETNVTLYFSESVYNASGDNLTADNFSYDGDNEIVGVEHTAGDSIAIVTLQNNVEADDIGNDSIEVTGLFDSVEKETQSDSKTLQNYLLIENFELTADDGTLTVSFEASEELDSVSVDVSSSTRTYDLDTNRREWEQTLTLEDFEEDNGTYTATIDAPRDGRYEAEFADASDVTGNAPFVWDDRDSATVDTTDPHPTDASISSQWSSEYGTYILVEFNEPISENDIDVTDVSIDGVADEDIKGVWQGAPNGIVIFVDGNVQTGDSPDVTIDGDSYVEIFDADGNITGVEDGSTTVHTTKLRLSEGTNFVSVPAVSGSVDIADLDTENVESIWTYEDGEWKVHTPGASDNDFDSLEGGQGYIFKMSSGDTLDVNSYNVPASSTDEVESGALMNQQELQEGWNLVGHYQEHDQDASRALSSVDSVHQVYAHTDDLEYTAVSQQSGTFETGQAYWVFVTEDEVYTFSDENSWTDE